MELEWDGGAEREHPLPWLVPKNEEESQCSSVQVAPFREAMACRECLNVSLVRNHLAKQELGQERADSVTFDWTGVLGERHTLLLARATLPRIATYTVFAPKRDISPSWVCERVSAGVR